MITKQAIHSAIDQLILSASGWRGIFAIDNNEESAAGEISEAHRIISGAAALIFADYLKKISDSPMVFTGCDTRPTGKAIADAVNSVLLASGCGVRYSGFTAAPEIMAWARGRERGTGFIYISASHNPVGFNGLKFGLTDGGVLAAEETQKLIADFRSFFERDDCVEIIESLFSAADNDRLLNLYDGTEDAKADALKAYSGFCGEVVWNSNAAIASAVKSSLGCTPAGGLSEGVGYDVVTRA